MKKLALVVLAVVLSVNLVGCATDFNPKTWRTGSGVGNANNTSDIMEQQLMQARLALEIEAVELGNRGISTEPLQVARSSRVHFVNNDSRNIIHVRVFRPGERVLPPWQFTLQPRQTKLFPDDDPEAAYFYPTASNDNPRKKNLVDYKIIYWMETPSGRRVTWNGRTYYWEDFFPVGLESRRDSSRRLSFHGGYEFNPVFP